MITEGTFEITHQAISTRGTREAETLFGRETEWGFAPTTVCGNGHIEVQIHPASSAYDYCTDCDGSIVRIGVDLDENQGVQR